MSSKTADFAVPESLRNLTIQQIDKELLNIVSEQTIRKYSIFPLALKGHKLTVAMADPSNLIILDDLRLILELDIEPVQFSEEDINSLINIYFNLDHQEESLEGSSAAREFLTGHEINEVSIVQLVHHILDQAIELRASDIHIEPHELMVKVRYRIDGILRNVRELPSHMDSAIVSRLKIMAELNIAVKRLPQDGRIRYSNGERPIDLRISTMPTVYGEKIVIRILDTGSVKRYAIDQLGFTKYNLDRFRKSLRTSTGMVLITGPTGSGKTTTLYAVLNELNHEECNFSTIEDPVEYRVEGVNQTQVNVKAGMTFAVGLRALLRQDPDVIMVGEIRDRETAEIAVHASSTGHLVLTTLHTNHALGAIDRLIHMGVEPFQVASSLSGVVAQRLVRRLCPSCKEEYIIDDPSEMAFIEDTPWENKTFYRAKGCECCNNIGYHGRMAIHETLLITGKMRSLIAARASEEEIKEFAFTEGMVPLKMDGLEKAQLGLTSIQEIMRVAYSNED